LHIRSNMIDTCSRRTIVAPNINIWPVQQANGASRKRPLRYCPM
jgi:hypothetical protein